MTDQTFYSDLALSICAVGSFAVVAVTVAAVSDVCSGMMFSGVGEVALGVFLFSYCSNGGNSTAARLE